jgi:hypothetical protein
MKKAKAVVPTVKVPTAKVAAVKVAAVKVAKVPVSELNVVKTAARLMTTKLVSTEISYVQRVLGASATQQQLDEKVLAVRRMPWASIALPD